MTTYTINLDDVDLGLLPMRARTNCFLEKEYFQFSVMKEEPVTETSDISYTCHICAIEVPAAFTSEHTASIKHRANSLIADIAMQRTRANISSNPVPIVKSSARFCANCAITVDEDHEKSKEHRVAAMHDNLLWELTKAYAGDGETNDYNKKKNEDKDKKVEDSKDRKELENDDNNNDTAVQTVKMNIATAENKTDCQQQNAKSCENNQQRDIHNRVTMDDAVQNVNSTANQSTNKVVTTTSRWVKLPLNENKDKPINPVKNETETTGTKAKNVKDSYETELRKFIDINNSYELKEVYNRIHIKLNDETLNIYSDHFHSYHRLFTKNNEVECIVCNCTLKNKDAEGHKYDLNHMSIVAKIGKDSHYIREINESYSHCILCNQKIRNSNVENHKQSNHHIVRKGNNVKSNKTKQEKTTNNGTGHQQATNTGIDNQQTANTGTGNQESENVETKSPYEEKSGELWCLVCECKVPKDMRNRKDHIKGLRHVSNMK